MTFTDAEIGYLAGQRLGRLATIQPDGSPQVKSVGFRYNPGLGTIDVTGFNMAASQKFRNVRRNGRAALVVDDIASANPWRALPGDQGHRPRDTGPRRIRGPERGGADPDPSHPDPQLRHRRTSTGTAPDQAQDPGPWLNREVSQESAPRPGATQPSPYR